MYVSGLRLGLTSSDLKTMPYMRLVNMLNATRDAVGASGSSGVREATAEDIKAFAM